MIGVIMAKKKEENKCRHPVWFNDQQKKEFTKLKMSMDFPEFVKLLFNNEILRIKKERGIK